MLRFGICAARLLLYEYFFVGKGLVNSVGVRRHPTIFITIGSYTNQVQPGRALLTALCTLKATGTCKRKIKYQQTLPAAHPFLLAIFPHAFQHVQLPCLCGTRFFYFASPEAHDKVPHLAHVRAGLQGTRHQRGVAGHIWRHIIKHQRQT